MPHKVATRVYTTNPNGVALVIVFIIGLGIFIFHLMSMSTLEIGIVGSIFLAVYLYVRYTDNPKWRMQVWDQRRLIFSSEAIDFGDAHYPVSEMETAAIYLDSFDGFKFRGLATAGLNKSGTLLVDRMADGDNNKISFRHHGEVDDFTFYLANYEQFAALQAVLYDWSAAGVNVVLKQTYDDDFIRDEMAHYNTPSS
jgi:hypothetical protein